MIIFIETTNSIGKVDFRLNRKQSGHVRFLVIIQLANKDEYQKEENAEKNTQSFNRRHV